MLKRKYAEIAQDSSQKESVKRTRKLKLKLKENEDSKRTVALSLKKQKQWTCQKILRKHLYLN